MFLLLSFSHHTGGEGPVSRLIYTACYISWLSSFKSNASFESKSEKKIAQKYVTSFTNPKQMVIAKFHKCMIMDDI